MYSKIRQLNRCFVIARTTKYFSLSSSSTQIILSEATKVFTTDRWDLYAVVQSTVHEVWARKYSGALKQDLRYSPSKCFDTYPFPQGQWETPNPTLAATGELYHEHRRALMKSLWLGLTDIYNLFHAPDLTPEKVAKVSKKPLDEARAGYEGILELRRLHIQLDTAVLTAYAWPDLTLGHDFVAVETLPENDRTRFTITPEARKELLKRLLAENHERAAAETVAMAEQKKSAMTKLRKAATQVTGTEAGERILPSEFRYAATEPINYAITLVVALLSEAGGELSWSRLLDAFVLVTKPDLMRRLAPPNEVARVTEWSKRWNERATPDMLIPSLNQLGGRNLTVSESNGVRVFALLDGPRQPATEDLGYDAWLGLRVAATLASDIPLEGRTELTKKANNLIFA